MKNSPLLYYDTILSRFYKNGMGFFEHRIFIKP